MTGEATPIEPQAITFSPHHQNMLDQVEQGVMGLWRWLEGILPEHPQKTDALNALKSAYDNAATVVRSAAEKAFNEAKQTGETELGNLEQEAVATGETVAGDVAQAAESVAGGKPSTPTAAASGGAEGTDTSAPSSNAASGSTETPTS